MTMKNIYFDKSTDNTAVNSHFYKLVWRLSYFYFYIVMANILVRLGEY